MSSSAENILHDANINNYIVNNGPNGGNSTNNYNRNYTSIPTYNRFVQQSAQLFPHLHCDAVVLPSVPVHPVAILYVVIASEHLFCYDW